MGFLRKLFPKLEKRSALGMNPFVDSYGGFGFGGSVTGRSPYSEGPPVDFDLFASKFYKGSAVVFATAWARTRPFSEITFKWRPMDAMNVTHALFGSPGLSLLENPWPNAKTRDLLVRALQDVDIGGNFFAVREKGPDGKPMLRRLRPDWVDIVLDTDPRWATRSNVIGYAYYPGGASLGHDENKPGPEIYLPEEVCHWAPFPDPEAQYRGMTWLTPALNDVLVERETNKHKVSFFKRGAILSTLIVFPPGMGSDEAQAYKDRFEAKYGGMMNSGRPMYIGGGIDVKVLETDFSKLDMKSIIGMAETHIAIAAGTHATVVGLSEGMQGSSLNAGNFETANRGFVNSTMRYLWGSFCGAVEHLIDKPRGRRNSNGIVLWYSDADVSILNDDREERAGIQARDAQTMNNLINAGWDPVSVQQYILTDNPEVLKHSGFVSVQLYKPSTVDPDAEQDKNGDGSSNSSTEDSGSVSKNQDSNVVYDPSDSDEGKSGRE